MAKNRFTPFWTSPETGLMPKNLLPDGHCQSMMETSPAELIKLQTTYPQTRFAKTFVTQVDVHNENLEDDHITAS